MSSILVIPDVHEDIPKLEAVLSAAGKHTKTVFLGDWFDSFQRTKASTENTVKWLEEHVEDPANEFLLGNHDVPYRNPEVGGLECSGHSKKSRFIISGHEKIWRPFKLATEANGFLLSHAGFRDIKNVNEAMDIADDALQMLSEGRVHPILRPGRARGGICLYGGCTWLDWNMEFEPIDSIPQIVGHTMGRGVRQNGNSYCIDTDLQCWAVIEDDGTVEFFEL